ncbi:MAG: CopG family antitoxin [bacterium]
MPKNFNTIQEFWNFWDTHSTADYEDLMEDVSAEFAVSSDKTYFAIARDLIPQLKSHARQQGISAETLINLWLREKVAQKKLGKTIHTRR